jgi:hypothetical protein
MIRRAPSLVIVALAVQVSSCAFVQRPSSRPTPSVPGASLWQPPDDLATRDLYYGPWGAKHAPDANAIYRLVERKHSGVNPGMTVVDPRGRVWFVKQASPTGLDNEGPVEVALSRLLAAIGYHQPPAYYLGRFTLKDDWGTHTEPGGRFALKEETLKEVGPWRWERNPFVGTREYQGLLVVLMMFNASDLKNSNNSLFERRSGDHTERWYVVRDLGAALGDTKRLAPRKNHPDSFERQPFIVGVRGGYVEFAYDGWYRPLVDERITPEDVAWPSHLLAGLSDRQWRDAFRAGGFQPQNAERFIRKLREKVQQGQDLSRRAAR